MVTHQMTRQTVVDIWLKRLFNLYLVTNIKSVGMGMQKACEENDKRIYPRNKTNKKIFILSVFALHSDKGRKII